MDGRSTGSLDYCFQSKLENSISALSTDLQTRPAPAPIRVRTLSRTQHLQGRPPLMGTLGIHQNIPASDTKLTHSLGIYSIGPPLVMEKLIPVKSSAITSSPEMSLLLEVTCTPAVIIKPRFILIMYMNHHSQNKTSN